MVNQNINYTQNQRHVAPFGNVVYSNTSIDNGFKRWYFNKILGKFYWMDF
jgi:hypothetical protein